ncbi:hypothetical protein [Variovorax sp. JS1663]|uniref:hypothetical protein n=1 Tax=Variovorax sp. JS1663 TaxID=1851577 RepID=UPI000B348D9C|nr:hypothetical protein [Variovorax sp. JS1663]OUM01676.1 hypothetical protein A8M77_15495 [Variovorax sp. JS1663]
MTKVALAPFPVFYDDDGNPLSGGKVFTYDAGTLVNRATYTDRNGGTPNANPVILDSAGRADIWLDLNVPYKIIVKNADESVVTSDVDNFYGGADPAQLTLAGIVPATGGTYTGPVSFAGGATFDGTPAQDLATINSLGLASVHIDNLSINSDFAIAQRAMGSFADGVYGFDQVVNLSQTAATTLSQLAQPTDGIPFAMRITQSNAAAQRIGFAQIIEAKKCLAYRGSQLVFAPKLRCSIATTLRVALVAWTGTLDAPTRDVVNNWASTSYTAGNFFVASTLPIAVGAVALSANTWTDVPVSSVSPGGVVVPSTMNNLYLVVWSDSTLAQNVTLDASLLRAGKGTEIPLWTPPDPATEFAKCERYFEVGTVREDGYGQGGQTMVTSCRYRTAKRANPTVAFQNTISTGLSANTVNSNGIDSCLQVLTLSGAVFLTFSGANNWQSSAEL